MLLTRESKLSFRRQPKRVPIKALGNQEIIVRSMTAARQAKIDARFATNETTGKVASPAEFSAAIVADCIIDELGEPMFSESELVNEIELPVFHELYQAV